MWLWGAALMADVLLEAGIYVIGFSFPVRASCLKPVCCGIDEWCSSVSSCRLLSWHEKRRRDKALEDRCYLMGWWWELRKEWWWWWLGGARRAGSYSSPIILLPYTGHGEYRRWCVYHLWQSARRDLSGMDALNQFDTLYKPDAVLKISMSQPSQASIALSISEG